ncbi:MAG: endonuclease/exonuclease/phosphatase family protein [Theionarchaea archaeon]|nr:endonuclease/exonuclease/phosphatase family protein [Theionarchaea archaeon]
MDTQEKNYAKGKESQLHYSKGNLLFVVATGAFLFFFEAARELVGTTYNMNLATMSINGSVVAVFAFFSPVIYFGLKKVNNATLLLVSGIILAITRGAMMVAPGAGSYLLVAAIAVISFGILLPPLISAFRSQSANMPMALTCACVIGAGTDLVFRSLGDTFDVTVYGFSSTNFTILVVVIPLIVGFVAALVKWYSTRTPSDSAKQYAQPNSRVRVLYGVGLGALGFLFMTLLGYPNNVARWVSGSYTLAALLYGVSMGGFLLIMTVPKIHTFLINKGLILGIITVSVAVVALMYSPVSALAIILSASALFCAPLLVYSTLQCVMHMNAGRIAAFLTIAAVTFVLLLLLSVFSLTYAYVPGMGILRNQIGTILIISAFLVVIGMVVTRRHHDSVPVHKSITILCGVLIILGTSAGVVLYRSDPFPPEAGESLKVMTYNIHQGYNTEGRINPWQILDSISSVNPDIIALQESDMNRVTSTNVDIVQWLAHNLDMHVYFGPDTKRQIYGVAILSRFPLTNMETWYLKSEEDQRVLIRADIEWAGNPLSIYAVHMGLSEEDRTSQTHEILGILSKNPNCKLLMGDLNSYSDSVQIEAFLSVLGDAWVCAGYSSMDPLGYTSSSSEPGHRIDYILVSKEMCMYISNCEVIHDAFGSDHLPVWADIVWPQ